MFDYLEGFEKRMQFAAVADSIVNRKNTNLEIESWFEDEELDNLFFSLLVYIMEQTLNENDECTLENITRFLDDILPYYNKKLEYSQVSRLAEYMVKDILQNKGAIKTYGVMNYDKKWSKVSIRLISDKITDDNNIVYQLTDQGYDFLFRTKEVDKELDFKLEQLKLKELLKRKNYKHALKQSRDLIAMLRQKKRELEEFIYRVRQNINTINKGEHEKLLRETYSLIDEEYEGMLVLKSEVAKDEARIKKEIEESIYVEEPMKGALQNLGGIKRNLQTVINEQRNLIAKRFNLNDIYEETIRNSFYTAVVKRFDFQKEVMEPLEQINETNFENLWKLMTPLYHPVQDKKLNLMLLYQKQGKLRENEEEESEMEEELLEEDQMLQEIQYKNQINYRIIEQLFKFAREMEREFTFTEFYEYIVNHTENLSAYTEQKRIFLIMLKLYEIEQIDLEEWKGRNKEEAISETSGEFDLAWCLYNLEQRNSDFFNITSLTISKNGDTFIADTSILKGESQIRSHIEMDELILTPVFSKEETDD